VFAHIGPVEVGSFPMMDNFAAVHDENLIGEFPAEIKILLDQQYGDPGALAQEPDGILALSRKAAAGILRPADGRTRPQASFEIESIFGRCRRNLSTG